MCDTLRSRRFGIIATGVSIAALGVALGGCSTTDDFRAHPTPNMVGAAYTQDDTDNLLTITFDTNRREMNEDWGRFLLLDRPMRTRRQTVPY